jgi:hypothetical protein
MLYTGVLKFKKKIIIPAPKVKRADIEIAWN